jgi:hypothetical protein
MQSIVMTLTNFDAKQIHRFDSNNLFKAAFPIGGTQGYVNLKAYGEFDGSDRPSGWNAWLTLVISPPAPTPPATTKPIITK